jgi:hypothetical protein
MKRNLLLLLVFVSMLITVNSAFAQDTLFNGKKHKAGFITGSGIQYIGQLLGNNNHNIALKTTYYYQVKFYQLQYYFSVSRKKTFGIEILAQPQYNTTKYKKYRDADQTEYLNGYEAGVNVGLLFRKNTTNDFFSFYLLISSGPHYISDTPVRQSNGFVFANNLCAGANFKIYRNLYADLRTGIRHMSNGGVKVPNAGINDMLLNGGFMVAF